MIKVRRCPMQRTNQRTAVPLPPRPNGRSAVHQAGHSFSSSKDRGRQSSRSPAGQRVGEMGLSQGGELSFKTCRRVGGEAVASTTGGVALVVLHKSQLHKEQRLPSTIRRKTDRVMVKSLYVL